MISNLEQLKANMDIVEIISNYLPLKKEGANFSACCPFHTEKTGSFIVNPNKQFFHCFGCNISGDSIKFVQEYRHLNFEEAVREIASLLNLTILEGGKSYKEYYEALESLNAVFKAHLRQNENVLKYLFNRGLDKEDLEIFDIGLIPNTKQELLNPNHLKELGLLWNNGLLANPNRISFALRNSIGKIVGFSCRTHPYADFRNSAKYINSKESKIFHKSQILYNLHKAREDILQKKEIIICEGFMDSIALFKLGRKNAVATCGTAFNATHLSQILKLKCDPSLKLCFDKDSAGENATLRTCELQFKNEIFNVSVVNVKNEVKDIGEVLEKKQELKLTQINAFTWYILKRFTTAQNPKEKDNVAQSIKRICNNIKNYYLKEQLIQKACAILKLPLSFFSEAKVKAYESNASFLEMQFFKSVLESKECEFLALDYISGSELYALKDDFFKYLRENELTNKAKEILCDKNIPALKYQEFKLCLVEILKREAKRLIKLKTAQRDTQAVLKYSKVLNELNKGQLLILEYQG